ncbi:hypothetical protein CROQUDRAFT_87042 [Cronartium quercuum f. sp. fusiforme G11]|uniref:Uncharacterized protein n=1 Tax=Cronartium quercuum f. sp. fusiforme G11 TaxID=708437 RepID=A0A9P6TGQ0_9BASI|nr:hypothetical protein CROQUDRAFT_87042 [Cronartium quercuum f. sp. fusiforme G11]
MASKQPIKAALMHVGFPPYQPHIIVRSCARADEFVRELLTPDLSHYVEPLRAMRYVSIGRTVDTSQGSPTRKSQGSNEDPIHRVRRKCAGRPALTNPPCDTEGFHWRWALCSISVDTVIRSLGVSLVTKFDVYGAKIFLGWLIQTKHVAGAGLCRFLSSIQQALDLSLPRDHVR